MPKLLSGTLWGLVLSQAPALVEMAGRLLAHSRRRAAASREERERPVEEMDAEELAAEVGALRRRIRAAEDAQVEQAALVQEIVEQNRKLAEAFAVAARRGRIILGAAILALLADAFLILRLLRH